MKTNQTEKSNLMAGGKEAWEKTHDFAYNADKIERELLKKYVLALLHEKNWVKRLFIKVKRNIEIRRRINELSSSKNLHLRLAGDEANGV